MEEPREQAASEEEKKLKKIGQITGELLTTERSHINNFNFAHVNFEPYVAHDLVDPEDKTLIRIYLEQWDILQALYDQLPFSYIEPGAERFNDFFSSQAFASYESWHIGMSVWTERLMALGQKYASILPVNSDGKEGANAVAISVVQRLPRHEMLVREIKRVDALIDPGLIATMRSKITLANELLLNDSRLPFWSEHTQTALSKIKEDIDNSALDSLGKIKAYHALILMIDNKVLGSEKSAEQLIVARDLAKNVFEQIKMRIPEVSTMAELVQLTGLLKEIRDAVQTPVGAQKAGKRMWGGESTAESKTIQKQLREYFADAPQILAKAAEIMRSSTEPVEVKSMAVRNLMGLVLEQGKVLSGQRLSLARELARPALNDAVEYYRAHGNISAIYESISKISQAVQSPMMVGIFKKVTGKTESDGQNKTIQKQFREFVENPRRYVASLDAARLDSTTSESDDRSENSSPEI